MPTWAQNESWGGGETADVHASRYREIDRQLRAIARKRAGLEVEEAPSRRWFNWASRPELRGKPSTRSAVRFARTPMSRRWCRLFSYADAAATNPAAAARKRQPGTGSAWLSVIDRHASSRSCVCPRGRRSRVAGRDQGSITTLSGLSCVASLVLVEKQGASPPIVAARCVCVRHERHATSIKEHRSGGSSLKIVRALGSARLVSRVRDEQNVARRSFVHGVRALQSPDPWNRCRCRLLADPRGPASAAARAAVANVRGAASSRSRLRSHL